MDEAPKNAIGFLTIVENATHGLFGGYLLLNPAGRPMEFHCTAPVKPNRAQQILYGPTLKPYLYGEQIATALICKSRIQPQVVFFNQSCAMCARGSMNVPMVLVEKGEGNGSTEPSTSPEGQLLWRNLKLTALPEFPDDYDVVRKCLQNRLIDFDLLEPFGRICDAIAEAQKAAGQTGAA